MNPRQFGVLLCVLGVATMPVAYGGEPKSVFVFSEDVGDDGRACGLSESSIVSTAAYLLQQSGFALIPEAGALGADFHAYINVNSLALQNDSCGVHISVQFTTYGRAVLPWNQEPTQESIELCNNGVTGIGPRSNSSAKVRESIEELTKACIVELKTPRS